ncbi:MAG: RimK/LysX family protein [Pseudomonadota bacterium]
MLKIITPCLVAVWWAAIGQTQTLGEVHVRGWVEHARLMPYGLLMEAKLDSGARTTSIHAEILPPEMADEALPHVGTDELLDTKEAVAAAKLVSMMVDGAAPDDPPEAEVIPIPDTEMSGSMPEMITFKLSNAMGGDDVVVTRPVTRWVSIRRRGGGSITRPVVQMTLCVAGRRVEGEVNLADRTGFNYPLLIGRNMLGAAGITVDSRSVHVSPTACPEAP